MLRRLSPLLLGALVTACTADGGAEPEDPNAGLLRDFLDGKFDAAGHPLNAKVLQAEDVCGGERLIGACEGAIPDGAQRGELIANVRLRVHAHAARGAIVSVALLDEDGDAIRTETLTVARLRERDAWIDLAVKHATGAQAATRFRITPEAGAVLDVDYLEIFPAHFGLVVSPGSGVLDDDEVLTLELPLGRRLERLAIDAPEDVRGPDRNDPDDLDLLPRLDELLEAGVATKTTTDFRTVITVRVGDLLPDRGDVTELRIRAGADAARLQLRRTPAACRYEGDPAGAKVLVTGFQPFPADGWHANVSEVAVTAMEPAVLRGAQVMRLVLPVEYDRAAAAIADVIERCAPDHVLSFGQGGGAIALEETAYNLQDTGEISGGVPDNRGLIRAAHPIDPAAPATRDTLLPLAAIRAALEDAGERPAASTDPGRYICNNVMFSNVGIMAARGGTAGFIHLPFTTSFDDTVRARFGRVVELAVQATVE